MSTVKKLVTDNDNLLFIGFDGFEESYLEMNGDFQGWSFMGLRPNTEQELRNAARERDIEDYIGKIAPFMSKYIDYEAFADDMEEEWYENHDVQAERENEEGEILYLGFGTGTSIGSYFKEHNITDYQSYVEYYDFVGLTEKEFYELKEKVGF